MLVKKKLIQMPIPEQPETKKFCMNAYIKDGIYHLALWENQELMQRIYSDGKNTIMYHENEQTWGMSVHGYSPYYSREPVESKACLALTSSFFKDRYGNGSLRIVCEDISAKRSERRYQTKKRAYDRMIDNIKSIPDDPPELESYCDTYVFKRYYAFVDQGDRVRSSERCRCTACGRQFNHTGKLQQRKNIICPGCGQMLVVIHQRYLTSAKDQADVLIFMRYGDDIIGARWEKITRAYTKSGKPWYEKDPYRWELHYKDGKIDRYKWEACAYRSAGYKVDRYDSTGKQTFVYAGNITDAIPSIHGADPEKLKCAGKVDFETLSRALGNETGRTLYKLGLYKLAEESDGFPDGETFKNTLGVGKEYLPIMRELNVNWIALQVMQLSQKHLSDEQVKKINTLTRKWGHNTIGSMEKILKYMSLDRMINYFYKQHRLRPKTTTSTMMGWYEDYRNMSNELNAQMSGRKIDMTKSAFVMPRDLKMAHDGVAARLKTIKSKAKERVIRNLGKRLQKRKPFVLDGLMILYPTSIEDFVREGAELKHCIGNGSEYTNGQASGQTLSVFIRRESKPEKPYYTATFYPGKNYTLRECHGYSHKEPPEIIRKLLKAYQEYMNGNAAQNDVAA